MLTLKQEKYVQNLVKGMSQREAYKKSYNASNMKDKTIDDKASLLFKKEEIRARYDELVNKIRDKTEKATIMSAEERMEWLSKIVKGDIKEKVGVLKTDSDGNSEMIEQEFPSKLDTRLKAIDTLNKMDGQYTTNIKGSLDVSYEDKLKQAMSEDEY